MVKMDAWGNFRENPMFPCLEFPHFFGFGEFGSDSFLQVWNPISETQHRFLLKDEGFFLFAHMYMDMLHMLA